MASDQSASPAGEKKRGWGCCLMKLTFLFLLIVGGAFAAAVFLQSSGQNSLALEIEAARAQGAPLDIGSYNQQYQVAATDSATAALLTTDDWYSALEPFDSEEYVEAGSKIGVIGHGPEPTLLPGKWSGKDTASQFLNRYTDSVVGLQLASAGTAYFEIDFTKRSSLPPKFVNMLYHGLNLLKLNCYVQVHQSNRDALASCLTSILRYSNCLSNQPGNQADRFWLDMNAFRFVGKFVHRIEFTPEQLEQFRKAAERDYWPGIINALHRERADRLWMYTDIDGYTASDLSLPFRTRREWKEFWQNRELNFFYSPFVAADAQRYLEYCDLVEADMKGDYLAAKDRIHTFEHQMNEVVLSRLDSLRYPTAHYVAPRISPVIDAAAQAEAVRRVFITQLALDDYRLANKKAAENLNDIVPDYFEQLPSDVYGNGPVRFRILPREVQVYSVGSNRADDKAQEDDIVFRLLAQKWNPSGDPSLRVD